MARLLQCNSCNGTYPDTRDGKEPPYFHVCPDEIIDQPEQTDEHNNVVKPATRKRVENPRNENLKRNPDKPEEFVVVSEGLGFTELN